MHYVTAGTGEPLVLLHGWPETWYQWRRVIGPLSERFHVIAPDLRGLGDTERPKDGYDKRTVSEDVFRLVTDHLGLQRICLVGHDWGGPVAFSYAAAHRNAVRRLALLDVTVPGDGTEAAVFQTESTLGMLRDIGPSLAEEAGGDLDQAVDAGITAFTGPVICQKP